MADIVFLEEKIKQLDPSMFQRLCDNIMISFGAKNLNSLGNVSGKRKTRKGTPDSFYYDVINNSYSFCEYTMESNNIAKKFSSDVQKCLKQAEKLDLKISEIVFIHSTNDLKLDDDMVIRGYCRERQIHLRTIGLTELASIINRSKYVLKTFFSIDESNRAIMTLDEFINENSTCSSSNMSFSFVGREKEVDDIVKALNEYQFVLITGPSGCGKSRIVVEALNKIDKKIICLNKFYSRIAENLIEELSNDEEIVLFIDDINQVSYAKEIIGLLKTNSFKKTKLISTVRNYAFPTIETLFERKEEYLAVQISQMSNDNITSILKKNLGIINSKFIKRILEIANGNIRVAILAGEESLKDGLASLYNSESLLATYYKNKIAEQFGDKYSTYVKVMFLVAFLSKIDIAHLDKHKSLLDYFNLGEEEMQQKSRDLTSLEVFKMFSSRVVSVDDQCLSNYIIYDFLIASKTIRLGEFLKASFKAYSNQIVEALNIVLRVYTSKESIYYIKGEILDVWNYFKEQSKQVYNDFVSKFASFNELETISYCDEQLFCSNQFERISKFVPFSKPIYRHNSYITILESIESPASIKRLFKALEFSSIRDDAYSVLEQVFTVKEDDFSNEFHRYEFLLSEIEKLTGPLFYEILKLMSTCVHQFHFSYSYFKKDHQFVQYSFELNDKNIEIVPIRHKIWTLAFKMTDVEKYSFVSHYFEMYPSEDTKEIFKKDLNDIDALLNSVRNIQEIREIDVYLRSVKHLRRTRVNWSRIKTKYSKEIDFLTQSLLLKKEDYEDEDRWALRYVRDYMTNISLESFQSHMSLLSSVVALNKDFEYKASRFLSYLIGTFDLKQVVTLSAEVFCFDNLSSTSVFVAIVNRIIALCDNPYKTVETIKTNKNDILLLTYFEICVEKRLINSQLKERFLDFVNEKMKEKSHCINEIRPAAIWQLLNTADAINAISYIFTETKKSNKALPYTLEMLFNPYSEPKREKVFNAFVTCNKLNVLFDIFIYHLSHSRNFYGAHEYTYAFAAYDVKYFKKIAFQQAKSNERIDSYAFKGLWEQSNSKDYAKMIFESFLKGFKYFSLGSLYLGRMLDLEKMDGKQNCVFMEAVEELFEKHQKETEVVDLLRKIVNETSDSNKIAFAIHQIQHGLAVEDFCHYNFFTSVESFSGSYIPLVNKKISFLEKLRDSINEYPELIEYERCVAKKINDYIKYREERKIAEALGEDF